MSELATKAAPAAPKPVPKVPAKTPPKDGKWRVTVRHSPVRCKIAEVVAATAADAWKQWLDKASQWLATDGPKAYKTDLSLLNAANEWLARAKLQQPEGVEVLNAEYVEARKQAMRIKGAVDITRAGGFEELASI